MQDSQRPAANDFQRRKFWFHQRGPAVGLQQIVRATTIESAFLQSDPPFPIACVTTINPRFWRASFMPLSDIAEPGLGARVKSACCLQNYLLDAAGRGATDMAARFNSRPYPRNFVKRELIVSPRMESRNGWEMLADFSLLPSTRKDNRTNFVSTPKIDNLNNR